MVIAGFLARILGRPRTGAFVERRSIGMSARRRKAGLQDQAVPRLTLQVAFAPQSGHGRTSRSASRRGNIDLDLRKVYRVRNDKRSLSQGFIRIIDESGEDYLYPISFFLPVRLSERAARVFRRLA